MSTGLASDRMSAQGPVFLPTPLQLASLGTVLCLYRGQAGGELAGWAQARRVEASASVDSDGLHECLSFVDAAGECCWKLFVLPDSDFLAWERLSEQAPRRMAGPARMAGIAERLLQRLAGRGRGDWQASVLQLYAMRANPGTGMDAVLAASLASVSPLGAEACRRIARNEGAAGEALVDECCCRRAAKAALAIPGRELEPADYPLVRMASIPSA